MYDDCQESMVADLRADAADDAETPECAICIVANAADGSDVCVQCAESESRIPGLGR